jgi:hypothetical protein
MNIHGLRTIVVQLNIWLRGGRGSSGMLVNKLIRKDFVATTSSRLAVLAEVGE